MSFAKVFAHPALSTRSRRIFWAVVALGAAARLVVAFATRGQVFDITSYELVRDALRTDPFHVYALVNTANAPHWPYPPGLFPWILLSQGLHNITGLRFDGFVQAAPIAADAALAWVVQAYLGQRGASDRKRLAAATLVALGPTFAIVSGYHGQIDSLVILPAVIAFWLWSRSDAPQRALVAGVLIGIGGAIKVPALLLVLALLASARSRREALTLMGSAAAIPLLLILPWLAADLHGTIDGLRGNKGLPGLGGISLLVQPDLSGLWLRTHRGLELSSTSRALFDHGSVFAIGSLLAVGGVMAWRRARPEVAVVLLWLTVYAFGINFGLSYLIWGMPFFLMTGRIRAVAALQAAMLIPMLLLYLHSWRDQPLELIYTPIMLGVWASLVVWWAVEMRALLRLSPAAPAPAVAST